MRFFLIQLLLGLPGVSPPEPLSKGWIPEALGRASLHRDAAKYGRAIRTRSSKSPLNGDLDYGTDSTP
jgi:hypothetical protein